jgi:hypothetical protein
MTRLQINLIALYLFPILVNHLVNLIQMTIDFLLVYVFYYLFITYCKIYM